jgi:hypothetical protein
MFISPNPKLAVKFHRFWTHPHWSMSHFTWLKPASLRHVFHLLMVDGKKAFGWVHHHEEIQVFGG